MNLTLAHMAFTSFMHIYFQMMMMRVMVMMHLHWHRHWHGHWHLILMIMGNAGWCTGTESDTGTYGMQELHKHLL